MSDRNTKNLEILPAWDYLSLQLHLNQFNVSWKYLLLEILLRRYLTFVVVVNTNEYRNTLLTAFKVLMGLLLPH